MIYAFCYALAHDSKLSTSHDLSHLTQMVNESRAVGLSNEEQNVKNDERNCRAVGRLTCHGVTNRKLSTDTKLNKEVVNALGNTLR